VPHVAEDFARFHWTVGAFEPAEMGVIVSHAIVGFEVYNVAAQTICPVAYVAIIYGE
jgi:hypothetical protein